MANMFAAKEDLRSKGKDEVFMQLTRAIELNDYKKFRWCISSQEWTESEKTIIGKLVIDNVAVSCACSVIDGYLDRDFGLDPDGWTAVHQAALNLSSVYNDMLLSLLFESEYSADVRGDSKDLSLKQVLPLNVALHKLRFGRRLETFLASTVRSAPSLLKELYTLDMELEVVRLLALNTTEFKLEFLNYAKEGMMVEVGALLLAAGEKLLPISISEGEDDLAFHSFKEISHFLQAKNNIDDFAELTETVKLLDIYDKIGNQLSLCAGIKANYRSGMEVASLLKDAGFEEKVGDHNFQDYVKRSNSTSFELKFPQIYRSWEPHELIRKVCEQPNMFPAEGELSPAASESFNKTMIAKVCNNPAEVESISEEDQEEYNEGFYQLMDAIDQDDSKQFPVLLRSHKWTESDNSEIGILIIQDIAVRCASLVVNGFTSGYIDRDFGLDPDGWNAVHEAARNIYTDKMLSYLLESGYSADVRGDCRELSLKQVLPLNVALHKLRFASSLEIFLASPDRSAPSLLKQLYTMDRELNVVRLLAVNTRELQLEFFNYAKEGKMVEVGALLLAAGEKLLPISISEGGDDLAFDSFKEISRFLQDKNNNIDEVAELKETVKLLDIYDKIGNQLSLYVALKENRRSGVEVAALLKDVGFDENIVDRLINASFEFKLPQINSIWKPLELICKQNMFLSKRIDQTAQSLTFRSESQQPSMPTRKSLDTRLFHSTGTNYAYLTRVIKPVNPLRGLNYRKPVALLMRFFPKGVRRV